MEDGGETFFPDAKEWFVSDAEAMQRCQLDSSCGNSSKGYIATVNLSAKEVCEEWHCLLEDIFIPSAQAQESTSLYLEERNISHLFPEKRFLFGAIKFCLIFSLVQLAATDGFELQVRCSSMLMWCLVSIS